MAPSAELSFPLRERLGISDHGHHLRTRQLLHHRVTFDVIEMRVAGEHDLDVGGLETKLRDAVLDDLMHLLHPGIDEDVSLQAS